jgi:hypothetical protein
LIYSFIVKVSVKFATNLIWIVCSTNYVKTK